MVLPAFRGHISVSGVYIRDARDTSASSAKRFACTVVLTMIVMLFSIGPGTIFPIVIAFGTSIVVGAIAGGTAAHRSSTCAQGGQGLMRQTLMTWTPIALCVSILIISAPIFAHAQFSRDPTPTAASQLALPYDSDYVDELFAAVAQANGMPDLRQIKLPPSYQEIRIADNESSVCCVPTPMLRLVMHDGQSQGELLLFRRLSLRPGNPPPRADERCVPLRDQHVCVRTWAKSIEWRNVAATLYRLGAWEITERCEYVKGSNSVTSLNHSGDLYIQRLIGRTLTQYRCNAPRSRTTTDAGRNANDIYQYFLQVVGAVPPD